MSALQYSSQSFYLSAQLFYTHLPEHKHKHIVTLMYTPSLTVYQLQDYLYLGIFKFQCYILPCSLKNMYRPDDPIIHVHVHVIRYACTKHTQCMHALSFIWWGDICPSPLKASPTNYFLAPCYFASGPITKSNPDCDMQYVAQLLYNKQK